MYTDEKPSKRKFNAAVIAHIKERVSSDKEVTLDSDITKNGLNIDKLDREAIKSELEEEFDCEFKIERKSMTGLDDADMTASTVAEFSDILYASMKMNDNDCYASVDKFIYDELVSSELHCDIHAVFRDIAKVEIAIENLIELNNLCDQFTLEDLSKIVNLENIYSREDLITSIKDNIKRFIGVIVHAIQVTWRKLVDKIVSWFQDRETKKLIDDFENESIPSDKEDEFNKAMMPNSNSSEVLDTPIDPEMMDKLQKYVGGFDGQILDIDVAMNMFEINTECFYNICKIVSSIANTDLSTIKKSINAEMSKCNSQLSAFHSPSNVKSPIAAGYGDSRKIKKFLNTIVGIKGTITSCSDLLERVGKNIPTQLSSLDAKEYLGILSRIKSDLHRVLRMTSVVYIVLRRAIMTKVRLCKI